LGESADFYILLIAVDHRFCCDFEMDPTANVCQILCKYRRNCNGDPGNKNTLFGKESRTQKVQLTDAVKGERGEEQSQKHAHHFLPHQGSVNKEFVLADQTVNFAYFCDALRGLRENMRRLRPELW
jgi:hypothetical protein